MSQRKDKLFELGKMVAQKNMERLAEEEVVARAGKKLSLRRVVSKRSLRTRWVGGIAVLIVASAIGVGAYIWPSELVFSAKGERAVAMQWYRTDHIGELPMRFSDGSTVLLKPEGRLRVRETTQKGALVELDQGEISVSVRPRDGGKWRFEVGPFTIAVRGTRFDAAWDPVSEELRFALHEGNVDVSGPSLVQTAELVAGQQLRLSLKPAPREASEPPAPIPVLREAEDSLARGSNKTPIARSHPARPAAETSETRPPNWQDFAKLGNYDEAIASAEAAGFERLCRVLSDSKLLELGNAARFAKRPDRATLAYKSLHARGSGSAEASTAAFSLGLIAFPRSRSIHWFETYLTERPNGPLAREAMGRLMEVLAKSEKHEKTARIARKYLKVFPDGPHAPLAKTILQP